MFGRGSELRSEGKLLCAVVAWNTPTPCASMCVGVNRLLGWSERATALPQSGPEDGQCLAGEHEPRNCHDNFNVHSISRHPAMARWQERREPLKQVSQSGLLAQRSGSRAHSW